MSVDLTVVRQQWLALVLLTPALLLGKTALITVLARLFGSPWRDGIRAGALLSPAGEFAFVLLPLGFSLGLLTDGSLQFATALAALSMLFGPVMAKLLDLLLESRRSVEPDSEVPEVEEHGSRVLVIGFGRFGQILNQVFLAEGLGLTVIDKDVERIRNAAPFGFRVYYGDGTRVDVLRAAGAARAEVICVCIDDREAALKIVEIVHRSFPQARTFVRSYDRIHAIELLQHEVDFQVREVFDSALALGRATLEELGLSPERAQEVVDDVRKRDIARLMMQKAAGGSMMTGADLLHGAKVAPEPLTPPRAKAQALNAETRDIIGEETF
jgi:voltage-gated potassium channel Kch